MIATSEGTEVSMFQRNIIIGELILICDSCGNVGKLVLCKGVTTLFADLGAATAVQHQLQGHPAGRALR